MSTTKVYLKSRSRPNPINGVGVIIATRLRAKENHMQFGKMIETIIRLELKDQQFDVSGSEALDHDVKLDFVIRRFPKNLNHYSVGLQVTVGEPNSRSKMAEFLAVHSGNYEKGVDRCLYVQIDKEADVNRGLSSVVGAIATQFQFDEAHKLTRLAGVDIHTDFSYSFFSLPERISNGVGQMEISASPSPTQEQLITTTVKPKTLGEPVDLQVAKKALQTAMGGNSEKFSNRLEGKVSGYNPVKMDGFLSGIDGLGYYFKFTSIMSDSLRQFLRALPNEDTYSFTIPHPILFDPGLKKKSSDKYPPASNLELLK